MKRIGLIGGISWESTKIYYYTINRKGMEALGEAGNPEILLYSINLMDVYPPLVEKRYDDVLSYMGNAAIKLEEAGAELLLICANTPHILAPKIQGMVNIPLLHIADAVGEAVKEKGLKKLALLGTPVTMQLPFYEEFLKDKYGLEIVTPDEIYHEKIEDTICNELDHGIFKEETKDFYKEVVENCKAKGAQGAILGCTEIPLILKQEDCDIPIFDSTTLHAEYAVKKALEK